VNECRHTSRRLGRYIDRELPEHQILEVEAHLQHCVTCAHELRALRDLENAIGGLTPPPPLPPFLTARILARASDVPQSVPRAAWLHAWRCWSVPMRLAATGVAAAALYLGLLVGGTRASSGPGPEVALLQSASGGPVVAAYEGGAR
jgi:anti-sigma factor RsiW